MSEQEQEITKRLALLNAAHKRREEAAKRGVQDDWDSAQWEYMKASDWFFQRHIVLWVESGEQRLATETEVALLRGES